MDPKWNSHRQNREFYEKEAEKVEHVFIYGVLPEIIGKWYTKKHIADADGIVKCPAPLEDSSTIVTEEDPERSMVLLWTI